MFETITLDNSVYWDEIIRSFAQYDVFFLVDIQKASIYMETEFPCYSIIMIPTLGESV